MSEKMKMPELLGKYLIGKVEKCFKQKGDDVKEGNLIMQVETNDVTLEVEASVDGIILYCLPLGTIVKTGQVLCEIGTPEEMNIAANNIKSKKEEANALKLRKEKKSFFDLTYINKTRQTYYGATLSIDIEEYPSLHNFFIERCPNYEFLDIQGFTGGILPRLNAIFKGIIKKWYINEGDYVKKGTVIADIESDFFNLQLKSHIDGILVWKYGNENTIIDEGDVIAFILEKQFYDPKMLKMCTSIEISNFIQANAKEIFTELKNISLDPSDIESEYYDLLLTK